MNRIAVGQGSVTLYISVVERRQENYALIINQEMSTAHNTYLLKHMNEDITLQHITQI